MHLRRRQGLASRLGSELGENVLQRADTRRQGIAIVGDSAGQKGDERDGFVFGKVKVLHGLDMGSGCPIAKAADLATLPLPVL
jgi:hypothetical protein